MNNQISILLASLSIFAMMSAPLSATSTIQFALAEKPDSQETPVYLIKSHNPVLKDFLEDRHSFDSGFTARLNEHQIAGLKKAGIDVEAIPLYQITKPPGSCSPWPDCNNGDGGTGTTRQFFPQDKIPYGVRMVKGGSDGDGVIDGVRVIVTVLDTGVFKDHLDLDVGLCKDSTKRGIQNGCDDTNGHGTHVSGTIAANGGDDGFGIKGVAPEANLWMIKVCGSAGCWSDDIAAAIKYATDQGTNIISMSLGGDSKSSLITNAVDYAVQKGVLVVAAAGNDGPYDGSIDYPGAYVKVVAVGAIDKDKNIPSWSSRGINDGDYIVEEREVEFGAPGVLVESTWNNGGYNIISGTSMATPHIAGLAAKLWQGNAADTRTYLQDLAKQNDLFPPGDDRATGFGLPVAP